jgi:hypothetical protein
MQVVQAHSKAKKEDCGSPHVSICTFCSSKASKLSTYLQIVQADSKADKEDWLSKLHLRSLTLY